MAPRGDWVERLVAELQFGLLPYCQAIESRGGWLMVAVLLLAGLAWWSSRTGKDDEARSVKA